MTLEEIKRDILKTKEKIEHQDWYDPYWGDDEQKYWTGVMENLLDITESLIKLGDIK